MQELQSVMAQSVTANSSAPTLDTHTLIAKDEHDTRGISPLHVSVIKSLSAVIGVDPTETCLNLSDYVSVASLDRLCDREDRCDEAFSGVCFEYTEFERELFVVCQSDGNIYVYESKNKLGGGVENRK